MNKKHFQIEEVSTKTSLEESKHQIQLIKHKESILLKVKTRYNNAPNKLLTLESSIKGGQNNNEKD